MRSPSEHRPAALLGLTLVGAVVALPLMVAGVRTANRLIVPEGEVVTEDLYVFAEHTIIEGVLQGDLFVVTGRLDVAGRVEGDVMGLVGGPASISGEVTGSVRIVAADLDVGGTVGDDVAAVAGEATFGGAVGRDLLAMTVRLGVGGSVGRDVRSHSFTASVDGRVGRDVLLRSDRLTLGASAEVAGDVLYRASSDAAVDPGASVIGRLTRIRTITPLWASAVGRVFALLSLLGLLFAGFLAMWAFPGLSADAEERVRSAPGRSALIGAGVLLLPPLMVLPLFLSLIGIPVALLLLVVWLVALFLGPLPAVTAAGGRLVRGRGGAALALLVGVLAWRGAMWLFPVLAGLLYLGALLVGLGGYGSAAWALRSRHTVPTSP